jgi:YHS domain-containing protein
MGKIAIIALASLAGAVCAGAETPKTAALEGLDPVLLTEGKEVAGKDSIALEHGRFLYQFSTAETRARFRKEPERYGIQLDGACARMGPPVSGSADAYFVYNHRIYVFGSSECYKRFTANPKKYLEAEQPKPVWNPTAETRAQGQALLDRTIEALGGAAKWDGVGSYAETRYAQGPAGVLTVRIAAKLPDSVFSETTVGGNAFGSLVTPQEVLAVYQGAGHRLPQSFGRAILPISDRDLLWLLLDRHAPGFEVYYESRAGNAERLQINDQGRVSTLLRDPESGKITAIEWLGASPAGYVTYHSSYSDYRAVGGLQLPFRVEGSAEGSDDPLPPGRSWTVESYELNPANIEARLRPPVKIAGQ